MKQYVESRTVVAFQIDSIEYKPEIAEATPFIIKGTGGVEIKATFEWMIDQSPVVGDYMTDMGMDVINPADFSRMSKDSFEDRYTEVL